VLKSIICFIMPRIFGVCFECNAACSMTGSMFVMHFRGICASEIAQIAMYLIFAIYCNFTFYVSLARFFTFFYR